MSSEPDVDGRGLDALDGRGDALGEREPARGDSQQDQVAGALVALDDLVGDAGDRTADISLVEDDTCAGSVHRDSLPRLSGRA